MYSRRMGISCAVASIAVYALFDSLGKMKTKANRVEK